MGGQKNNDSWHELSTWNERVEDRNRGIAASLADADDDSLSSGLQFVTWQVMTTPIINIMTD